MAARLFSLPCHGADSAENTNSCNQTTTAEAMRQEFEAILNEPLPERFTTLVRTLREEEAKRAAARKSGT